MTTREISGIFFFLILVIAACTAPVTAESPGLLQSVGAKPLPFTSPSGNFSYALHVADNAQLVTLNSRYVPDLFVYSGNGSFLWNRTFAAEQTPWISSVSIAPDAEGLIITQQIPACCHGSVTYTSSNKVIYLDSAGEVLWDYPTMNPPLASGISATGQDFFIGTDDGHILCLNQNGTLRWTTLVDAPVISFASSGSGDTLVATGESNYYYHNLYDEPLNPADVFVLDRNGTLLWKYQTGGQNTVAVSDDGSVITILEERSGNLQVFNRSGSRMAKRSIGGASSDLSMARDGNLIVAETRGGTVYGVDRTGALLWRLTTDPGSRGIAFSGNENSFLLGNGTGVSQYDRMGNLLGEYPAIGQVQVIESASDAHYFVAGTDRYLIFYSTYSKVTDIEIPGVTPLRTIPAHAGAPQTATKALISPGIPVFALAGYALWMRFVQKR